MDDGYDKPRSICQCGHTGDGPNSQHHAIADLEEGTGSCKVKGCKCIRFTWANFTKEFAEHIKGGHTG